MEVSSTSAARFALPVAIPAATVQIPVCHSRSVPVLARFLTPHQALRLQPDNAHLSHSSSETVQGFVGTVGGLKKSESLLWMGPTDSLP